MKPERFTKLEIAALALLIVAILAKPVWSIGAYLFEDPANNKSYPNKTNAGFLATTSGTVEVQTMAQPKRGQFLRAGTGTAQGTDTAASAQFGDIYPTDIVGLSTGVGLSTATPASVVAGPGTAGTGTSAVKEGHAHQLGSNTPTPGMLPFAGTGTATGTSSTANITWRYGQASDISGLPTVSGTPNYLAKFGAGGVVDSHILEDTAYIYPLFPLNFGSTPTVAVATYDDGVYMAGIGYGPGLALQIFGHDSDKRISFGSRTRAGVYTEGMRLIDGTLTIHGGLVVNALPGKGIGKYLYDTDGAGTIGEKAITASDVGAEPTLPVGNVSQFLQTTGTGTGTSTQRVWSTITIPTVAFSTSTPAAVATSGAVGTSTLLSRSDHDHAEAPYRFSTSTPVAVGTSGAVGYSQELSRSDHRHAYSDDHMVGAVNGNNYGYLYDILYSSLDSITVAPNLSQSPYRVSVNTTFGTSTPASVGTSGSVGTANTSSRSDHVHAEGTSARTPTAHGSTHNPGGTDVPSAFTNTPGVGKVATLTAAGQNLNGWISTSADPFTNTPGIGKVATLTAGGQDLNAWITGKTLLSSTTYTDGYLTTSPTGAWQSLVSHTFTTTGTQYKVHVEAVYGDGYANARVCAIGIMANTGSSATTLRGPGGFERFGVAGAEAYNNVYAGMYLLGSVKTDVSFTLAAGTVTIAVAGYAPSGSYNCFIPTSSATLIVDVYK
ncbi:MAG: hypothetical protein ABFE07_09310 [Armatimonadia bacterium]